MKRYKNGVLTDCGPSRATPHTGKLPGFSKQRARTRTVGARNPEPPPQQKFPCPTCDREVSLAGTECWHCEYKRLGMADETARREAQIRFAAERQREAREAQIHMATERRRLACMQLAAEAHTLGVELDEHLRHVRNHSPHAPGSAGFYDDWGDYLTRLIAANHTVVDIADIERAV